MTDDARRDSGVPRTRRWDSTSAFLRHGYSFIGSTCDELGGDAFRTRLMLRRVLCLRGVEAAEFFYGDGHFHRRGALPRSVRNLLQDKGSVQMLEGGPHRHRKRLFTSQLTGPSGEALVGEFSRRWDCAVPTWRGREIVLHDELLQLLGHAGFAWAGIDPGSASTRRIGQLAAMIEHAGSFGLGNWRARARRLSCERWARQLIRDARAATTSAEPTTPLETVASFADPKGRLLPTRHAAVELLNLLRPTIAVGRFIVFAAVALHDHPELRSSLAGDDQALRRFVQEVRRTTPFFPAIGGRASKNLRWDNAVIRKGDWVLLDLYGTNRHRASWDNDPHAFDPGRFARAPARAERRLVPQGAGTLTNTHRCPGEDATISLTMAAVRRLCVLTYHLPPQDLTVDLTRLPALPASGVRLQVTPE
jgi:fatty-acid peroxygenase